MCEKLLKIDAKNIKGLYRRSLALIGLQEFEKASADLRHIQEIDPGNADAKQQMAVIKSKQLEIQKKEKKVWGKLFEQNYYENTVEEFSSAENPRVYFDIKIGSQKEERIEFELYQNIVPKTAKNFIGLATGDKKYKTTIFHRLIKDFMIQGGDYENRNGTGGKSIYGDKFQDENFKIKHTERGLLSMANSGPNTNGSQFFITFKDTPHLNGKHVVFGKVVKNIELLDKLEAQPVQNDKPVEDITVVDCGLVEADKKESQESQESQEKPKQAGEEKAEAEQQKPEENKQ